MRSAPWLPAINRRHGDEALRREPVWVTRHVGQELRATPAVAAASHGCFTDFRVRHQGVFNFRQFNPDTSNFHLAIDPSEHLQIATG